MMLSMTIPMRKGLAREGEEEEGKERQGREIPLFFHHNP
jgi:hypothetical protein